MEVNELTRPDRAGDGRAFQVQNPVSAGARVPACHPRLFDLHSRDSVISDFFRYEQPIELPQLWQR